MSFLTGTQFESINNQAGPGSALTASTAATVISKSPGGAAYLPAGFFPSTAGVGKRLFIEAYGIISTVSSSQGTLKIGLYANTTQGTVGSNNLGDTGAVTPTASASNWFWKWEARATMLTTGSSATWQVVGSWFMYTAANGTLSAPNGSGVGSTTAVTLSTQAAYYLELVATWGTNNANSITCYDYAVYGTN